MMFNSSPVLTEGEKEALIAKCFEDPVEFLQTFLPHLFPQDIPWVHRGIIAILTKRTKFLVKYGDLDKIVSNFTWKENPDDPKSPEHPIFEVEYSNGVPVNVRMTIRKFTMLMIPRGFSKTTLAGIGIMIYWVVYQEVQFAALVSETATHSSMQLSNVRRELETNEMILLLFGKLAPERNDPEKWTDELIETRTGVVIVARGRGGQIRGLNNRGRRPDRILIDDLENKESVSTPEQRLKCKNWAYGDLIPALPALNPDASIVALGTLLHPDALLMQWLHDPDWTSIKFGVYDKQGDPLWSTMMDGGKIEALKRSYARQGQLHIFSMEYLSKSTNEETQKFKAHFFIHRPVHKNDCIARALVIDPAISEKAGSDACALGVVGMQESGKLVVLDTRGGVGMLPREQVDNYFELSKLWDCTHHGVESVAYQAALIHLLREEMFRKGQYFEITPITHSAKKTERIEGILQPRYANGYIIHNRRFIELETQLLEWPSGKKDYPDVISMCIALLDPYAAQATPDDKDLAEDEYEDLEDIFDGEWRARI